MNFGYSATIVRFPAPEEILPSPAGHPFPLSDQSFHLCRRSSPPTPSGRPPISFRFWVGWASCSEQVVLPMHVVGMYGFFWQVWMGACAFLVLFMCWYGWHCSMCFVIFLWLYLLVLVFSFILLFRIMWMMYVPFFVFDRKYFWGVVVWRASAFIVWFS